MPNDQKIRRSTLLAFLLGGLTLGATVIALAADYYGGYIVDKGRQAVTTNPNEHQVIRQVNERRLDSVTDVAWSPDGKSLATTGHTLQVSVWDAAAMKIEYQLDYSDKGWGRDNVAFSPDGRYVAFGLSTVSIWETASRRYVRDLVAPHDVPGSKRAIGIVGLAYSPDGRMLVVAYALGRKLVVAYRIADGSLLWSYEPQRTIGKPGLTTPIQFSPDGRCVVLGTGETGGDEVNQQPLSRVLFLDADSGTLRKSIDDIHVSDPTTLAVSADGRWVATGTTTGSLSQTDNLLTHRVVTVDNRDPVRVWDVETGKLVRELPVRSRVWSLAFSHDGKYLFGARSDMRTHSTLAVWDVESGKMVQEIENDPGPMALAVSPDGKRLAAACQNKLSVYELATDN